MAAPGARTWTVAELSAHLTRLLATAFPDDLWVQGQIRNLKRASSGHVYFDLAEPAAAADAPSTTVAVTLLSPEKRLVNDLLRRAGGAVRMDDGIEVRIRGRMRWWAPRGEVQFRMSSIDPAWTLGRMAADRERVLAALAADGLLHRNRGRPFPLVPLRVGLVTSAGSAAHADFLAELESSGLAFRVRFADARTQGLDCERSIVAALRALAGPAGGQLDVVVLVRGGGSRTDLAAFDGDAIARAVATMPVPVVTGIGHEIDTSITDAVAHRSAKTPTAAAAELVDAVRRFQSRTDELWVSAARGIDRALAGADERLRIEGRRIARATRSTLDGQARACDDAARRLRRAPDRQLTGAVQALAVAEARALAHDPGRVLARGWSLTRTTDGHTVRRAADVEPGDELLTILAEGRLVSRCVSVPPDGQAP